MRAAILTLLTVGAALPAFAQSVRPLASGPINVIRPTDRAVDPAADTTPTIFFTGPRRPATPASEPRAALPGDDLVVWRSASPMVRSVAGSDAGYMLAQGTVDAAPAPEERRATGFGTGAAPSVVLVGGWYPPVRSGRGVRYRSGAADAPRPTTVAEQFPRAWIGGVSWSLPSDPIVPPPRAIGLTPRR
jgi:hypothetical protein